MEVKNNMLRRVIGIYLHPIETFQEISKAPTSWKQIFLLLLGILTIFFVYLVQIPSGLTSILIGASFFPIYLIILLFIVVMIIFSLVYFLLLYVVYEVGIHLRISRKQHRSKKIIFNLYIYSLTPLLLIISQIPFILIFGGHYSLFSLNFFYLGVLVFLIGWHMLLLYRGIQIDSDINAQHAKYITGIYIGIIGSLILFLIFAILYINFDISWLGLLFS